MNSLKNFEFLNYQEEETNKLKSLNLKTFNNNHKNDNKNMIKNLDSSILEASGGKNTVNKIIGWGTSALLSLLAIKFGLDVTEEIQKRSTGSGMLLGQAEDLLRDNVKALNDGLYRTAVRKTSKVILNAIYEYQNN